MNFFVSHIVLVRRMPANASSTSLADVSLSATDGHTVSRTTG